MHGFFSPVAVRMPDEHGNAAHGNAASDQVSVGQIQDFFRRRWKLILATTIATVALSLLVLLNVTPKYTATSQVLLDPRKEKIFGNEQIVSEFSVETANIDSQSTVI